ncbi:hypothetical protein FGO68_gene10299 [Halteria grandinella]|uniref:Uncharacterized protein n=1 Tax=Halteria grandinella TaxID=5974 RepID=A0A8J8NTE0_HALGN|nr:hypothetical protein FGO68_gene10299 [Halteria grandinella]
MTDWNYFAKNPLLLSDLYPPQGFQRTCQIYISNPGLHYFEERYKHTFRFSLTNLLRESISLQNLDQNGDIPFESLKEIVSEEEQNGTFNENQNGRRLGAEGSDRGVVHPEEIDLSQKENDKTMTEKAEESQMEVEELSHSNSSVQVLSQEDHKDHVALNSPPSSFKEKIQNIVIQSSLLQLSQSQGKTYSQKGRLEKTKAKQLKRLTKELYSFLEDFKRGEAGSKQ